MKSYTLEANLGFNNPSSPLTTGRHHPLVERAVLFGQYLYSHSVKPTDVKYDSQTDTLIDIPSGIGERK